MRFTHENEKLYLGPVQRCFFGYAEDAEIRSHAASGGIVSAILIELLESGIIDGAVVVRMVLENGAVNGKAFIATSRDEIIACGGSIYSHVLPLPLNQIREFQGRLGFVGIPCNIRRLISVSKRDPLLDEKIAVTIGLFCGHNSKKELIGHVLNQKKINVDDIDEFYFRRGRWRGKMEVRLKSGKTMRFPFSHFSIYQNLHFFSQKKCIFCADHTAEHADISSGDAWLKKMKHEPIKHSIFLSRTSRGGEIIDHLKRKNRILVKDAASRDVFMSQKRALIHHKSTRARARMGKWLGYSLPSAANGVSRWNDYPATFISLFNLKWSESVRYRHLIFKIPKPVLFLYLFFFKLLTNF